MKAISTSFIILSILFCPYLHIDHSYNIWGKYLIHDNRELLLNLCENNEWFFTDCQSCLTEVAHSSYKSHSSSITYGTYELINNNLELRNNIGELFFSLQVIDTMNIKVLYAKKYLDSGDYFNRYSSYFKGQHCSSSSSFSDFFARWTVFDSKDSEGNNYYEILRFTKPGFVFKNEEYEVGQLQGSIFKIKKIQP